MSQENLQASCVVCGNAWILAEEPVCNELIACTDCGTELEVTALNPVQMTEAPMEEEDWGQ